MNKNIYATSDEKFVKATVLFSSEDKIYYDEACTEEVTLEDALNLFKKGLMLVSVDGGFKRPTGITVTESGYEISYGGNGGSGAEDFVATITGNFGDSFDSDKTAEEIFNAVNSGKNVYAEYVSADMGNIPIRMHLAVSVYLDSEETYGVIFSGFLIGDHISPVLFQFQSNREGHNVDALVENTLPYIHDDDIGKVLMVSEDKVYELVDLPTD